MRIRFTATKDDFLVVIAAGNDGAGSPDKTVATALFFLFAAVFLFFCFELFSLMFATGLICILSDWSPGSVQELPVCRRDPAQRGPTHCRF